MFCGQTSCECEDNFPAVHSSGTAAGSLSNSGTDADWHCTWDESNETIQRLLCTTQKGKYLTITVIVHSLKCFLYDKQLFSFLLLKKKTGREVRWSWLRVGILESIGNLGLNNFDSDDD